MSTTDYVQYTK